jgi:hypothetical protein
MQPHSRATEWILILSGSKSHIMGSDIIMILVSVLLTGFSGHVRKCSEQRYQEGLYN